MRDPRLTLILVRRLKPNEREEYLSLWQEAIKKHVENEEEGSPIKLIQKIAKALRSPFFELKENMDIENNLYVIRKALIKKTPKKNEKFNEENFLKFEKGVSKILFIQT